VYTEEDDPLFCKKYKNIHTIGEKKYMLKQELNQYHTELEDCTLYTTLLCIDDNIKYDVFENKRRNNSCIVYKREDEICYGRIKSIYLQEESIGMELKEYDVQVDDSLKIDDLFLHKEHYEVVDISPDMILTKFITVPYVVDKGKTQTKWEYIVTTVNKSFY